MTKSDETSLDSVLSVQATFCQIIPCVPWSWTDSGATGGNVMTVNSQRVAVRAGLAAFCAVL